MKKLIVIMLSLGLALGASAQRGHGGGGHVYVRSPRVVVGIGAYSPFYSPYYGLGLGFGYPFGYPYGYPYNYGYRHESKLDLQIADIKSDYQHQIKDTRRDKSIPRSERKAKIRDLKYQREKEITQAKRDYFDRAHRRPNTAQPNQAPQNQSPQNPAPQNPGPKDDQGS